MSFFFFFLIDVGGRTEGKEKNMSVPESGPPPFGVQDDLQPIEPHSLGFNQFYS